jgi:hypothetical protein
MATLTCCIPSPTAFTAFPVTCSPGGRAKNGEEGQIRSPIESTSATSTLGQWASCLGASVGARDDTVLDAFCCTARRMLGIDHQKKSNPAESIRKLSGPSSAHPFFPNDGEGQIRSPIRDLSATSTLDHEAVRHGTSYLISVGLHSSSRLFVQGGCRSQVRGHPKDHRDRGRQDGCRIGKLPVPISDRVRSTRVSVWGVSKKVVSAKKSNQLREDSPPGMT